MFLHVCKTKIQHVRFVLLMMKYSRHHVAQPQSHAHVSLWGMLLACGLALQNVNITHIHALALGVNACLGRSGSLRSWQAWRGVLCHLYRWVFIYEKGYQSTDTAVSSVFTKMKGVGYTNVNGSERVWDVADYVFPPQVGHWLAETSHACRNIYHACPLSCTWYKSRIIARIWINLLQSPMSWGQHPQSMIQTVRVNQAESDKQRQNTLLLEECSSLVRFWQSSRFGHTLKTSMLALFDVRSNHWSNKEWRIHRLKITIAFDLDNMALSTSRCPFTFQNSLRASCKELSKQCPKRIAAQIYFFVCLKCYRVMLSTGKK